VGCATGETIRRLNKVGYKNLVGVDASASMLNPIKDTPLAQWIHSENFPSATGPYQVVLCNWTLHFIRQKVEYLTAVYESLNPSGLLILTEKTSNGGIELQLYHDFKRSQGVSEQEIDNKAYSVQDIMFVDSYAWYLEILNNIGFKDIKIINASPCFTTFMAVKN
jgi:trans-aconitate methyltransferase